MAILQKLKEHLVQNGIKFAEHEHKEAFTSLVTAHRENIAPDSFAKTVIVKMDNTYAMAVLPASHRIDLKAFKDATHTKKANLATEKEFAHLFPECEIGAMPPFGNLFNVPVWVDKSLTEDNYITFNAGSHTDSIDLKYADFEKLVHPHVANFSAH